MAIHEIITGVMILLGWLFGLGAISSYSPRAQQKESQPEYLRFFVWAILGLAILGVILWM